MSTSSIGSDPTLTQPSDQVDSTRTAIVAHYEAIFDIEAARLEQVAPVEHAITARHILKRVTPGSVVADVGVGVGHYAELVARFGCTLQLIDISERFLTATRDRLERAGLGASIRGTHLASAVRLASLGDDTCDAVLMLGPLYHLPTADARVHAVAEAARVLKPGGQLFAAGINRLAYFRDLLRDDPSAIGARGQRHRSFMNDGILTPTIAPQIGWAHLTTVVEFRALFGGLFREVALTGVEAFASERQVELMRLPAEEREKWLDFIEEVGVTAEGLAAADHFLFIGTKGPSRADPPSPRR